MKKIKRLKSYIEHVIEKRKINVFKTLYLNFSLFSFAQALRFPVICYGKVRIRCLAGEIRLKQLKKGIILIGIDHAGYRTRATTTITLLEGSVINALGAVKICQGCSVLVGTDAKLELDDGVRLGDGAEIICKDSISLGRKVDVTWDCQITDFSSHPMRNIKTGQFHSLTKPVKIGDYCWIGNRSTIMPGTVLPERVIVAANSLLNKDYIEKGILPFSVIGGMPAKLLNTDIERTDFPE